MTRPKAISAVLAVVLAIAVSVSVLAASVLAGSRGGTAPGPAGAAGPAPEATPDPSTAAPSDPRDPHDGAASAPSPGSGSGSPETTVPADARRHEVLPGAGSPPAATPDDPIGGFGDDGPVPAGLGFTAPPHPPHAAGGLGGPTDLAVAPSCSHQCITEGVAYARGFGAELVVEAELPVRFFLTAVADPDGDGDYQVSHADWSPFGVTSHSWSLDHLLPGQTYHVMVSATDDDGHTAYAWGEFTTLSQRTVYVELGTADVFGGPGGVDSTTSMLGLNGTHVDASPGLQGILLFHDLPRHLDVDYWMVRSWDDDICESWVLDYRAPHGGIGDACVAWSSAAVDDVDLDLVPGDAAHWTETDVELSLHPPTGEGEALPPGYGDPYYFSFEVPVTLHVTYS